MADTGPVIPSGSHEKRKEASRFPILGSQDTIPKQSPSSSSTAEFPAVQLSSTHADEGEKEMSDMESVPLIDTKTMQKLAFHCAAQQKQIMFLRQQLAAYKLENNKQLKASRYDRFEGIKKDDVMTQFSCKWFVLVAICNLAFLFIYYIWRKGSQFIPGEDELDTISIIYNALFQVSIYSGVYLFMILFDIFWNMMCPDRVRCERTIANTHVIVAAHRAHESLEEMLPTVLQAFPPGCVWVADNGYPDKDAEALCRRLGVNYEYNEIGNKANALVVVARKIKRRFGDHVKNVVLLDDDTQLAPDFFVRHDLLADPRVGGYCVGIAVNREKRGCFNMILTAHQAIDYEYRAISHGFAARSKGSSMQFCHGNCAVYKLDLMIEMYSKNWSLPGGLPFGEDGYAGLIYRANGYRLLQDNANVVLTYCPRQFFPSFSTNSRVQGYGADSLWRQRGCRWFLSWPRQLPLEIWLFFNYNSGSWYGNITYRVYLVWWLFLNCVSVAWIPYMLFVYIKKESWIRVLLLKAMLMAVAIVGSTLRIMAFPRKLRKGLHPMAPLLTPILGLTNSILRFFGFLFSIYWFIPFFRVNSLRVLGDDYDEEDDLEKCKLSVSDGSTNGLTEFESSSKGLTEFEASSKGLTEFEASTEFDLGSRDFLCGSDPGQEGYARSRHRRGSPVGRLVHRDSSLSTDDASKNDNMGSSKRSLVSACSSDFLPRRPSLCTLTPAEGSAYSDEDEDSEEEVEFIEEAEEEEEEEEEDEEDEEEEAGCFEPVETARAPREAFRCNDMTGTVGFPREHRTRSVPSTSKTKKPEGGHGGDGDDDSSGFRRQPSVLTATTCASTACDSRFAGVQEILARFEIAHTETRNILDPPVARSGVPTTNTPRASTVGSDPGSRVVARH